MTFLPATVDAVAPKPVIATGGIAAGRGLAALRMLATAEALMHAILRRRTDVGTRPCEALHR